MKVRGLSAIITTIVLAMALLLGSRYLKSQNMTNSDDMKSQLTPNEADKNTTHSNYRTGLKAIIAGNLKKRNEMTERLDFQDESLLIRERVYTEAEINEMTEMQFIELLKITESKLPTIADIKQLPSGALHHTPAPIMQAGKDLGLLKEVLKVHESYEREALIFYEKCAKLQERPMAIKALCLTNMIQITKKNGKKLNLAAYPKEMIELTKLIIDI